MKEFDKDMMSENDDGIFHKEGSVREFCSYVPIRGDGEIVRHSFLSVWPGFFTYLGTIGAHGSFCIDIWV